MASNLAKAMQNNEIYCTINNQFDRQWRDFTLQKNHMFGYSPELKANGYNGLFVVHQVRDNYISLYLSKTTRDEYVWTLCYIPMSERVYWDNDTVKRIREVASTRIGKVEFYRDTEAGKAEALQEKYDFSDHYKPEIVTGPFMPMPHMRIPMGKRGKNAIVTDRKMHEFKASNYKEFSEKCDEMQYNCVLVRLDLRAHRAARNIKK